MKSSELLKAAREGLWDGANNFSPLTEDRFICLCISYSCAHVFGDSNHALSDSLRHRVIQCLDGQDTMEDFLAMQLGIDQRYLHDFMTRTEIQQKRFELVDKLIAEYEEKGD